MDWMAIGEKIAEVFLGTKNVAKVVGVISNPMVGKVVNIAAEIAEPLIKDLDELENYLEGTKITDEPMGVLMSRVDSIFGKDKFEERTVKAILEADGDTGKFKKQIVLAAITDAVEKKVETKVKSNIVDLAFEIVYEIAKRSV